MRRRAHSVEASKRTLTLKFTKAGRRALAHRSRARVKLRVTLTPRSGPKRQTATLSVTLQRRSEPELKVAGAPPGRRRASATRSTVYRKDTDRRSSDAKRTERALDELVTLRPDFDHLATAGHDTIVVLGAGQRGLACVIAARAAGAGKIIVTDLARAAGKLEFARELGADATIVADEEDVVARVSDLTGGRGADIVVDVTPTATQPVIDAVAFVRNGGTIVLSGVKGGPKVELDTDEMVRKSITMRGVFTVDSPAYRRAIRLLESGAQPFDRLHTASYPLERAEEAIHHLAGRLDGPPAINVAIAPHKKEG